MAGTWDGAGETGGAVDVLAGARAFNKEMAPSFLDHVAMLAGFAPPPGSPVGEGQGAGFAWCELHCGSAVTATLLAASNPLGDFHGIDARAGLLEEGRALAAEGGVRNLTLHDANLERALDLSLPQFDYVMVSGVYSWVPARERALVLAFLRKFLRPGGLAYVTYNARPGWNRLDPFRRLYREATRGIAADLQKRLTAARELYAELEAARAPAIVASGVTAASLDDLDGISPDILAADYANDFAEPLYVTEVASDFAAIDCTLASAAEMAESLPVLMGHEPFKSALQRLPTGPGRELVKDMLRDTRFRRDVFVRGGARLSADNREMMLTGLAFALERPAAEIAYQATVPFGRIEFDTPESHRVVEALAGGPRTMADLFAQAGNDTAAMQAIVGSIHVFLLSQQIRPVYRRTREAQTTVARLSAAVLARATTPAGIGFLPADCGTAFQVPVADQIFSAQPQEIPAQELAEAAIKALGGGTLKPAARDVILRRARSFARSREHYLAMGLSLQSSTLIG